MHRVLRFGLVLQLGMLLGLVVEGAWNAECDADGLVLVTGVFRWSGHSFFSVRVGCRAPQPLVYAACFCHARMVL